MNLGRLLFFRVNGYWPARPRRKRPRRRSELHPNTLDWRYRGFVRRHACCACGSTQYVEAAHTGAHGLSLKAPDRDCIPLCARCHRTESFSLHVVGPERFQHDNMLDFRAVVHELRGEWQGLQEES